MVFYATTAQVILVLLLALIWDSVYLKALKADDRANDRFWTKPRARAWTLFVSAAALIGEAAALLVLAGGVAERDIAEALGVLGTTGLMGSIAVRLAVDIVDATKVD